MFLFLYRHINQMAHPSVIAQLAHRKNKTKNEKLSLSQMRTGKFHWELECDELNSDSIEVSSG